MATVAAKPELAPNERRSFWIRLRDGERVLKQDPDWIEFVGAEWPERIMAEEVTDRSHAKQGRSIGRWTLTAGDEKLVVYLKRHYVLPRSHGFFAALFPSSAWSPGLDEWNHLASAKAMNLPVPRAVAGGEFRGPWGKLQSFLAVEELAGMLPLHEAIPLASQSLSPVEFSRWKRGLIDELARLSCELHRRRYFHQDLYLCHFYILESDAQCVPESWFERAVMIDFHRLARHRLAWQWWQLKDLAQLLFSTFGVEGITDRDRARFWKCYRRQGWNDSTPPPRWLRPAAMAKARRYDRHNANRAARNAA